jgi:hypothetical protein
MAPSAPRPGGRGRQAVERKALEITLNGETLTLNFADLGPEDDLASRKQTGLPISSFVQGESFGTDSFLVLWWMARRKAGERRLAFSKVLDEFPTFDAINAAEPKVEVLEDEAEVDDSDPLPSGER